MLVNGYYPEAEVIRVVVDNLKTHTPAAVYETFPPAEAHRILQRVVSLAPILRSMFIFLQT